MSGLVTEKLSLRCPAVCSWSTHDIPFLERKTWYQYDMYTTICIYIYTLCISYIYIHISHIYIYTYIIYIYTYKSFISFTYIYIYIHTNYLLVLYDILEIPMNSLPHIGHSGWGHLLGLPLCTSRRDHFWNPAAGIASLEMVTENLWWQMSKWCFTLYRSLFSCSMYFYVMYHIEEQL